MDGLAAPAALAALGLALPIILTYMLRTRRPRQVVPSTFLWREATHNVAATRPFQRLRPSVLLLLQLLLLTALVLALAKPFRSSLGVGGSHLVLVVDTSGSMLAADEVPSSRVEAARRVSEGLIESLSEGAVISLISAESRPRVLVSATPSRGVAQRALDDLEAAEGSADFAEAFLLAESLETPARPATIVLVTDGGLTPEESRLIPPGAVIRSVGRTADNLAVTRLDTSDGPGGFRAIVQVRNFGPDAQHPELVIELNGSPVASVVLSVPGSSSVERSFDLGATGGRLVARITSDDRLAADDRAFAVLERSRPRRILIATVGNVFLESLVRQVPGAEVTVSTSEDPSGFDLAIYDRIDPPEKLEVPAMFIAPPKGPPMGSLLGSLENPSLSYLAAGDALLAQVDLVDLAIAAVQHVEIPGARTLLAGRSGATETPILSVWTQGTLRRAYLGFDLHESNLPLQVAFPILGDHLLGWLGGAEELRARYAGEPLETAAPPSTTEVRIRMPGGREASVSPGQVFDETERAGFYTLNFTAGSTALAERTVALSFPPRESDILPRGVEAPGGGNRPGLVTDARTSVAGWVLLAALFLLLIEWWWAHGRPLPPPASLIRRIPKKRAA